MSDDFEKAYQSGIGGMKGDIRYVDQFEQKRQRDIEGYDWLTELYSKPMSAHIIRNAISTISDTENELHELKVKYEKLLAFTKRMTDIGDLCCMLDIEIMAEELLRKIGEI